MIDERFTPEAFARLGPGTPAVEARSQALAVEIADAMRGALAAAVREVVERLRGLGHDLQEWEQDRSLFTVSCSDRHTFGPLAPRPIAGWLAISIDISALTLFAEEGASAGSQDSGEQAGGDTPHYVAAGDARQEAEPGAAPDTAG